MVAVDVATTATADVVVAVRVVAVVVAVDVVVATAATADAVVSVRVVAVAVDVVVAVRVLW